MATRRAALLLIFPAISFAAGGTVTGEVFDPSHAPIPTGRVTLISIQAASEQSVQANELGTFQFGDVPAGTYKLVIMQPGFRPATVGPIQVADGVTIQVPRVVLQLGRQCTPIKMGPPRIEVRPTATRSTLLQGGVSFIASNLSPQGDSSFEIVSVPSAMIEVEARRKPQPESRAQTDSEGKFQIEGLAPGFYRLRASKEGYRDFITEFFEIKRRHATILQDRLQLGPCQPGRVCGPPLTEIVFDILCH